MDNNQFSEISKKFDLVITFLALNLVKDAKTQKEKIVTLSALGLKPAQIAGLLGTTSNTVSVALSGVKKKGKKEALLPQTIEDESVKEKQ